MTTTGWTLTVLSPHDEDYRPVAAGTAPCHHEAGRALVTSLIDAVRRWGRQEFTGVLGQRQFSVLPGLTASGLIDEEAIHRAIGDLTQ